VFADGGPALRVRVTDIAVSTVGAWAAATVSLYGKVDPNKAEMVAQDSFFRSRGKWFDTTVRDRTPPRAVTSDLGLEAQAGPTGHKGSHTRTILIVVGGVLGLLVLLGLGAAARDPEAFSASLKTQAEKAKATAGTASNHKRNCPSCGGAGTKKTAAVCYACGGRGVVEERDEHGNMQYIPCNGYPHGTFVSSTCESCHGAGTV
jgi:hypothetical protein